MKVLMAAPFDANGRYKGGIGSVVNTILLHQEVLHKNSLDIIKFNTCRIERPLGSDAKIGISNIKNSLMLYNSIIKAIYDKHPDILYYHSSVRIALLKDLLIIRHAKQKTGIKTIIHIHFADYEKIMTGRTVLDNLILMLMRNYVDEIVFLSQKTRDRFIQSGIQSSKCSVIYNFSTLTINAEKNELIYQEEEPIRFLFVGAIGNRKGFFDLIEAIEETKIDNFELHVCGTPSNDEAKQRFNLCKNRLEERLFFHGFVSGKERDEIYKKADIVVLPSYAEGLPMVILEAFNAGCAVISTEVGAIPEIVTSNNGVVIKPGDVKELSFAIKAFYNNVTLLKKIQCNNIDYSKNFTCEVFISKMADICRKGSNNE